MMKVTDLQLDEKGGWTVKATLATGEAVELTGACPTVDVSEEEASKILGRPVQDLLSERN